MVDDAMHSLAGCGCYVMWAAVAAFAIATPEWTATGTLFASHFVDPKQTELLPDPKCDAIFVARAPIEAFPSHTLLLLVMIWHGQQPR